MFHLKLKGRGKKHGDFKAGGQQMCTQGIHNAKQFTALLKKNNGGGIFGYVKQNNNNNKQKI